MPTETTTLVLFAVASLVFLGMTGILAVIYRSVEHSSSFDAPNRRRRARMLFGIGAIGVFIGFEWFVALFTFDISLAALDYAQLLYVGIGVVFVASVPLSAGLLLAMQASNADGGREVDA